MLKNEKEHESLPAKLITTYLPLYGKEFPLMFFWTPKAGCTSLIKWFYFQIGLLQEALDYNQWIHFYRDEVYEKQENFKEKIIWELLNDKKDIYKLVRNPYKRAVSSYIATLSNEIIMNEVAPGINEGLSFKQYLYLIKDIGVGKDLINVHIAQQYIEEEELFIQNYLHLEQFTTSIREIEKKYSLKESPIEKISTSPHHIAQRMTDNSDQVFSEVKLSQETVNKPLPPYKSFYDRETKDIVRELYKQDFEKYGYEESHIN